jgi:hypothetical protein
MDCFLTYTKKYILIYTKRYRLRSVLILNKKTEKSKDYLQEQPLFLKVLN